MVFAKAFAKPLVSKRDEMIKRANESKIAIIAA
jgi:hypothetical protein